MYIVVNNAYVKATDNLWVFHSKNISLNPKGLFGNIGNTYVSFSIVYIHALIIATVHTVMQLYIRYLPMPA